ncbi:hypothetical protein Pint_20700 [Pistacia integerrima]|uniref:Uncharacterized protein n=1 Tax=Pistacia integerrima TaxID=434235 RepID=A0ACC0X7H5_9ROSI|nr:hypothetical protein Pint_20700 [Pistacia integerrima]
MWYSQGCSPLWSPPPPFSTLPSTTSLGEIPAFFFSFPYPPSSDCLLCPTGFAANMAVMVAIGSIASLLAVGDKPLKNEKIAIFSDALNHASIIDGIRLVGRTKSAEPFIYKHYDMSHLKALFLFSMD